MKEKLLVSPLCPNSSLRPVPEELIAKILRKYQLYELERPGIEFIFKSRYEGNPRDKAGPNRKTNVLLTILALVTPGCRRGLLCICNMFVIYNEILIIQGLSLKPYYI